LYYATLEAKGRLLHVPKHLHLRPVVTALGILSALMPSTCGAKESVMSAKKNPRCAPAYVKNQALDVIQV